MKRLLAFACVLLAAGVVRPRAGGIYLSPTLIALDRDNPVASLLVRNDTDRPAVFQVRGFAWTNAPDTSIQLTPTDDLIVYPSTIQLAAGETRRVRVGHRSEPGVLERGFRLILDELPSQAGSPGAMNVGLVTRMQFSLPVFLQSRERTARVDMSVPELGTAGVRVRLTNTGATHVTPEQIEARGLDASGATVWTRSFRPWYLLAGEARVLEATVAASDCAHTQRVVADATFAEGRRLALHEEHAVPADACQAR